MRKNTMLKKIIILILFTQLAVISLLVYQTNFFNLFEREIMKTVRWRGSAAANISFDKYCEAHGEWEAMGQRAFAKRAGVFYFIDADFLRILMVRRNEVINFFLFTVDVRILKDNEQVAFMENVATNVRDIIASNGYKASFLDAQLNLTAVGVKINASSSDEIKRFTFQVSVFDQIDNSRTKRHLTAMLKNLESDFSAKKSSLLCLRCYLVNRPNEPFDFVSLKWWVEINKKANYDKVELCDHGMSQDFRFERFFNKHRDFLILNRLDCLPNLEAKSELSERKYITASMLKANGQFSSDSWDIFHHIFQNECYMQHMDAYRFVAILDMDEVVIPKMTRPVFTHNDHVAHFASLATNRTDFSVAKAVNLQCDRYDQPTVINKSTSGGSIMDFYLRDIINASNSSISVPQPLHFTHGYPIGDYLAIQLFDGLEKAVKKIKHSNRVNISIKVIDNKRPTGRFSFKFTIQSDHELNYALGILKAYRTIIQPFLRTNKALLKKCAALDFSRFFVLNGDMNNFQNGKTLADTRITFDLSIHYTESIYERDRATNRPVIKFNKRGERLLVFPSNIAHMSHFRTFQKFSYKSVSIESLFLDLNYMNCYFMPLLREFSAQSNQTLSFQ
jgi:hypothetical protein